MKHIRFLTLFFILFILAGCRASAPTQPEAPLPPTSRPDNAPPVPETVEDLPLLPSFVESNTNGIGEPLPDGAADPFAAATFSLKTDLMAGPETATVEQHQFGRIDEAQARALANQFGFTGPLFVQQIAPEFAPPEGEEVLVIYTAFDGQRLLNISDNGLTMENRGVVVDYNQRPSFSAVAPQVETQLKAWGLLDFPYVLHELPTGDLAIYRLIDGLPIEQNAYNVLFNQAGEIAYFEYQPLREVETSADYPLQSASAAWEQLQDPADRTQMRYQLWPQPVVEEDNAQPFVNPRSWSPNTNPGQELHLYISPAVYETTDGSGLHLIFGEFTLTGNEGELDEMAAHLADVIHVWGTTGRTADGAKTLELVGWEVIELLNYESLEGSIIYEGETALLKTLDGETYILAAAPTDLPVGVEVYVSVPGRRDTGAAYPLLDWISLTEKVIWPNVPVMEEGGVEEKAAIQTVTINAVDLIYFTIYPQDTFPHDSLTNLFIPVWKFSGETDQKQMVTIWVPAVAPEYIQAP